MAGKSITYAQKLGGMLASLTTFVCCCIIFLTIRTMTMNDLIYALSIIIPAAVITGFLGFQIGKIFDSKKKKKSLNKFIK